MRTREKGYRDYCLDRNQVEKAKAFCKNAETAEEMHIVGTAANMANKTISGALIMSVQFKISYERLLGICDLMYSQADFYGYRRKFLFELYNLALSLGYIKE